MQPRFTTQESPDKKYKQLKRTMSAKKLFPGSKCQFYERSPDYRFQRGIVRHWL